MGSVSNPSGSVLGVFPSIQFDHVHISAHMGVVVEAVVVLVVGDVSVDIGFDDPVVGVAVDVIVDGVSVDVYVTVTDVGVGVTVVVEVVDVSVL